MSIVKIRSLFEHRGCQVLLVAVGIALAVGLTLPTTCPGLGMGPGGEPGGTDGLVVAEVAGRPVSAMVVSQVYSAAKGNQPAGASPMIELDMLSRSLDNALRDTVIASLASQRGLKVTEEATRAQVNKSLDETFAMQRDRLIQEKKLKAGATDAEFIAAIKKEAGRTPDEIRKEQVDSVVGALADPTRRPGIETAVLRSLLQDSYLATKTVTEDQVKKSYDELTLKRLVFQDPAKSADENRKAAEAALQETEGGAKWAAVFAKYGKSQKDTPTPVGRAILEQEDLLKPLLELKPGGVALIEAPSAIAIYKLEKIENKPPANWATNKIKLIEEYKTGAANRQFQTDIDKAVEQAVWKDEGYRVLFEAAKTWRENFGKSPAETRETMLALVEKIDGVQPKDGLSRQGLILAKYVAFESFFNQLTPKEQAERREDQVATLQSVLEFTESPEIRLKVYDSLLAGEMWEQAGDALSDAATNNGSYDAAGQTQTGEIRKRLEAAEKAAKIDKAALDGVKQALADWESRRKEDEASRKEEEANQKKIQDELDKLDEPGAKKEEPKAGQPK